MGCPRVRGDNPQALVSGLFYVQVDKHGITIRSIYHLHLHHCKSKKEGNDQESIQSSTTPGPGHHMVK